MNATQTDARPFAAVAIAAGLIDSGTARITLSLQPTSTASIDDLQNWPDVQIRLLDSNGHIPILAAPDENGKPGPGGLVLSKPAVPLGGGPAAERIRDLWKRMMNPGNGVYAPGDSPWDDLRTILQEQAPAKPVAVLSPPHAAISAAYTLERGRLLLEAAEVLPARAYTIAASLCAVADRADNLVRIWPTVLDFARDAAGTVPLPDGIHLQIAQAHDQATPGGPPSDLAAATSSSNQPPTTPQLQAAQQRLGALAASPVLQRLFGLALDVLVPVRQLAASAGAGEFVWLALDPRCWTLTRIQPASMPAAAFYPANPNESPSPSGTTWQGMRNLAQTTGNGPRYDLCTIDPTLAVAAAKAAASTASPAIDSSVPDLHNGGLRLIDCQAAASIREKLVQDNRFHSSTRQGNFPLLLTADDLAVSDRLIIGLQTGNGLAWRSPLYRHIRYEDPASPHGWPSDWVEDELTVRGLGRHTPRRMELDAAELHQPLVDDTNNPTASKYDGTVAAWGGEPMGVTPASHGRGGPEAVQVIPVVGELDITRHYAAPTSFNGDAPAFLSPLLRFGWPYFTALIRVFPCGVACTLDEAGATIAAKVSPSAAPNAPTPGDLALPSVVSSAGRRFLRHERLHAPTSAIAFADFDSDTAKTGDTLIVRTSNAHPHTNIAAARRILVTAPVPLFFAALHDVLAHVDTDRPPQGIPAAVLMSDDTNEHPARLRVVSPQRDRRPFYPDPAASYMALRLSGTAGQRQWAREPVIVRTGGVWPETLPVHVTVRSTRDIPSTRIERLKGRYWLGPGEVLTTYKPFATPSIEVAAIEVLISPGETVQLDAWSFPRASQLANLFDAVEAATILQTLAEESPGGPIPRDTKPDLLVSSVSNLCHCGVGSLPTPPTAKLAALADLVFRTLQARPVPSLSAVKSLELVHAVDASVFHHPTLQDKPFLVRRLFPGGNDGMNPAQESRLQFINAVDPADWEGRYDEPGAIGVLLAGPIQVDLVSTGGLRVVAHCPSPRSDNLDQQRGRTPQQIRSDSWDGVDLADYNLFGFHLAHDHRVTFRGEPITLLEIDGLPVPEPGGPALQTLRLEDLQAAAWGTAKPLGGGLRAVAPGTLTATGARALDISIAAVNRHAPLLGAADSPAQSEIQRVWLPSTKRPAPPVVHHTQVAQHLALATRAAPGDDTFTVSLDRTTAIRIWLSRPWWSSGQDEQLGVVLWPPGLFASGVGQSPRGEQVDMPDFADDDLGPGGKFVTRWAADAHRDGPLPKGPLIPAHRLQLAGGGRVRDAFMPLPIDGAAPPSRSAPDLNARAPGETTTAAPLGGANQAVLASALPTKAASSSNTATVGTEQAPTDFLEVALLVAQPLFDPREELFYVYLSIDTRPYPMPHVRLGLVRYQEHAREDRQSLGNDDPVRLRVSTPVTEWVQPLPHRTVTATCQMLLDTTKVTVVLSGPSAWHLDGGAGAPAVEMEIVRHKPAQGDHLPIEETAWSETGLMQLASWDGDSIDVEPFENGLAWVGLFMLAERLDASQWNYAVLVRETERMRPAASLEENPEVVSSGPKFFARLELTKS
jgi:hypothetical protein